MFTKFFGGAGLRTAGQSIKYIWWRFTVHFDLHYDLHQRISFLFRLFATRKIVLFYCCSLGSDDFIDECEFIIVYQLNFVY